MFSFVLFLTGSFEEREREREVCLSFEIQSSKVEEEGSGFIKKKREIGIFLIFGIHIIQFVTIII